MNIHEHQAKDLLRSYDIPVPRGLVAFSEQEVEESINELKTKRYVVKAQIHAGGRGKAGGVKLFQDRMEATSFGKELLGKTLVTPQTGIDGKEVKRLLIEEAFNIKKEYYLSLAIDREREQIVLIGSVEGGMSIEDVAKKSPDAIIMEPINLFIGLPDFQARRMAFRLGLSNELTQQFVRIVKNIFQLFTDKDCSQIEINPLVLTVENQLYALDAKINFDDNAIERHPDIASLRDYNEEDEKEVQADLYDLSYIALDGTIGCMVNGAGLAMATMDIIKHNGGNPANFLDVGGSATTEKVEEAFKIIMSDPKVEGIFVNIFGGIMKCDVIAKGIVEATKNTGLTIPLVVRLAGTNVEVGQRILKESGLNIVSVNSLGEGAETIVSLTK